ncbi:MAG TPA: LpqB family beta-propeller domain-containing protein, partial [Propionibacteriaceae bacterium]
MRRRGSVASCRGARTLWRSLTLLVAVSLLALSGCVTVPTSGPVERIDGQAPPCQNCVNVELQPPAVGDEPRSVVEGYLLASSVYQPNYAVAKQYLTKAAAETWSPEAGAQIYSGTPTAVGRSKVVLQGRLQGLLGPDRTYTAQNRPLRVDFGLVKEGGEWRISKPPAGLMVAEYYFTRFFTSYNVYFIGNGATLVPDPIYLPNLPSQANVASVLMKSLLDGPSRWLQPAVRSALPTGTDLSVDSVTVQDGIAQVPLSEAVLALNDRQRSLLAAQVVYTLKQAFGIEGVLFLVNQKPFRVPESDNDSLVVAVDQILTDVDPVPFVAGDQVYAVRGRSVQLVDVTAGSPNPRPVPGPLGAGKYAVDSLAISVTNTDIAAVTDGQTVLRAGLTTARDDPSVRLSRVTNLLRPQYSRYGELWAVADSGGQQKMWLFNGEKRVEVGGALLADGRIVAFRISPDGARMAVVRAVGKRMELGLARINRADITTVDGWRPLNTSKPDVAAISLIRDVGWLGATELLVLGAAT